MRRAADAREPPAPIPQSFADELPPPASTTDGVDERNPLMRAPGAPTAGAPPNAPAPRLDADATLRNIRISPKKLARFVKLVAGMHVDDALAQCAISQAKAARITSGVVASARANAAANHGLDPAKLRIGKWGGGGCGGVWM